VVGKVIQLVSVFGAITILAAYGANQFGRLRATGYAYTVANVVGAAILSYVALHERQWGFLLLDGVWTVIGLAALGRMLWRPQPV
jgi:hypothetical protein